LVGLTRQHDGSAPAAVPVGHVTLVVGTFTQLLTVPHWRLVSGTLMQLGSAVPVGWQPVHAPRRKTLKKLPLQERLWSLLRSMQSECGKEESGPMQVNK
jgi:hypothetical protein